MTASWQRERSKRLQRVCEGIDRRVSQGWSIAKAARHFAKCSGGRPYHCDRERVFAPSAASILRHFYAWKRQPTCEAFRLKYRTARQVKSAGLVDLLVRECLKPGNFSFLQVYRVKPELQGVSYRSLVRAVGKREREQLKRVFRLRSVLHHAVRRVGVYASAKGVNG